MEVFLAIGTGSLCKLGLLHVRGGVSKLRLFGNKICLSSPRPWRCFRQKEAMQNAHQVFSTSVEVFPPLRGRSAQLIRLLHVRGGVSTVQNVSEPMKWSSPRPWRCFRQKEAMQNAHQVFSTSVEVFPTVGNYALFGGGLLHVRGGVSTYQALHHGWRESSPRPWRCFLGRQRDA